MVGITQIEGFWGYMYWGNFLLAVFVMLNIILTNRNPIRTLAWIMVLLFIPFLGLVLYFFFGRDTRKIRYIGKRSLSRIMQRSHLYYRYRRKVELPPHYLGCASYLENTASSYPMPGSGVEVITDTARFMEQMLASIEGAKEHIHFQFYIFEDDELGCRVRDLLAKKASEGVEVRVIYDSVGSWKVSSSFFNEIERAGGEVESFLKVYFPILGNRVNYRNHRKVVVVDGKYGFIGGCNIADRYVKGVAWGPWRDTMLAITGSAVHGLQTSFLIDWYFASGTLVCGADYFPELGVEGSAVVQVAQSNPVGNNHVIMSAFVNMLALAKDYVYIQTPYIMLTDTVSLALRNASLSGVDVRLMVPLRGDNLVSNYAGYSYLGDLIDAGVKVYLYADGFIHSKTVVSDGIISSVGSANFDFRSFYYNFEVTAFVYDASVATQLKTAFEEDMKKCRLLSKQEYASRSFVRKCVESAARLLSPLL